MGYASLLTLTAALALTATPALAARGHVYCEACSFTPAGANALSEPAGVAINESSGDVYVADKGNNRIEYLSSAGAFEGELTGPSADGSGTLTEASTTIESVLTTPGTGAFAVGEEIKGEGIPAATTITAVPGGGVLEISQAVEAGKSGLAVVLTAHQSFSEPTRVAVDNSKSTEDPSVGDVYVVDAGHHVVDKFTETGEYLGQIVRTPEAVEYSPNRFFTTVTGVAVDSSGRLWVAEKHHPEANALPIVAFDRFSNAAANQFEHSIALPGGTLEPSPGLAVGAAGAIYVEIREGSNETFTEKFTQEGGRPTPLLDHEPSIDVATEPSSNDVYVLNAASVSRLSPANTLLETLTLPGVGGTGVAVDFASRTVFVSEESGAVAVYTSAPPAEPLIENDGVTRVTSTSASFFAEINPRSLGTEEATEYAFEFGACPSIGSCAGTAYDHSTPAAALAPDFEPHPVTGSAVGLLPSAAYHYRVRARNAHGAIAGPEHVFTTQPVGEELALPDGRMWELVSQPDKHGAQLEPLGFGSVIQASAAGDAITYIANAATEPQPPGETPYIQVLSTHRAGAWETRDIGVPHNTATGPSVGNGSEYRAFSPDLALAAVQPFGDFMPSLSAEASEQTPYLRTDFTGGDGGPICATACYRPLVTGKTGDANVPEGLHFGQESSEQAIHGPEFAGASPDLAHIVLKSDAPLTLNSTGGLYELTGGTLTPLGQGALGFRGTSTRHAVSNDGTIVVLEQEAEASTQHLVLHDLATGDEVQIDSPESGTGSGPARPRFQIASGEGTRIFFTDTQQLTNDAGAAEIEGKPHADLYECQVAVVAGHAHCRLRDLTPMGPGGERASVLGGVLGAGNDGSRIYFVANGVIGQAGAHGAKPGSCEDPENATRASAGRCNLYEIHEGELQLVAVLANADLSDWNLSLEAQPTRVSDNGEWLTFPSVRPLTGYDNRDASSGASDVEVFLYHASTHTLTCVSCNPTGTRPHGLEDRYLDTGEGGLAGGSGLWPHSQWVAANTPGWTSYGDKGTLYQSRYLSNEGRVYFNSSDALVPQDINGTEDVYEFEQPGSGNCSTGAPTFVARDGGCLALISSGTSREQSAFIDASETGGDVFFLTSAQLSGADHDTSVDVYDARECSTNSPCSAPSVTPVPPCDTADSCEPTPPPEPSIFGQPPSATFSGPGNVLAGAAPTPRPPTAQQRNAERLKGTLKRCRRLRAHRHRRACEVQARKAYHMAQSKLAGRTARHRNHRSMK